MKIIETIKEFAGLKAGCCLTIGNFDGVHVGHQKILAAAREACRQRGKGKSPLVVAAFEPHPVSILHPEKTPERLTPLILKEQLLAGLGADFLFLLKPDKKLLSLSAEEFVRKIIVEHIKPSVVVEGEDFRFGAGRTGNVHTLTSLGADNGFEVITVDSAAVKLSAGSPENPVRESRLNRDRLKSAASSNGVKVSSTLIRNLLIEGRAADAAVALGRPYRFVGKVVSGKGKGKLLGFPTANLGEINQLIPAEAVYAATAAVGVSEEEVRKHRQDGNIRQRQSLAH